MDINALKKELDSTLANFQEELKGLKAGRASAHLVEKINIDYFGSPAPIQQVAQITIPDPGTIMISPFNKDDLPKIEKAINESNLNINPNSDGQAVFLKIPPMTEERREEIVKIVHQKAEEARVSIRQKREKVLDQLNAQKKTGDLSEDGFFQQKEELQKVVDQYMEQVDAQKDKKEEEIKF